MKALYLRITELYKKRNGRLVSNWALHGRLNSSTDTEIRKFLMEFRRIFMSKYYDYFEEQEHNSGEITMDNAHE